MAVSINGALSPYVYSYQGKYKANLDKNSDSGWDKEELQNYANAYNKATGKTLDVDALWDKYSSDVVLNRGDSDERTARLISPDAQALMQQEDALGFSNIGKTSSSSDSASDDSAIKSSTAVVADILSNLSGDRKTALFDIIRNYTYDYSGTLQPKLDTDEDGLWSRDELQAYADAYKKATGNTINVDSLMEKYGGEYTKDLFNEDGVVIGSETGIFIDPTQQGEMVKDDALGLSALQSAYNSTVSAAQENYYQRNTIMDYDPNAEHYRSSSSSSSSSSSLSDIMGGMSASSRMNFASMLQRLESGGNALSSMLGTTSNGYGDLFSLVNARTEANNAYKQYMAGNSDEGSLYNNMSGMAMNFSI